MSTITVVFKASEKLQKELLRAGQNANRQQKVEIEVDPSSKLFEHCRMTRNGQAVITFESLNPNNSPYPELGYVSESAPPKMFYVKRAGGDWYDGNIQRLKCVVDSNYITEIDRIPDEAYLVDLFNEAKWKALAEAESEKIQAEFDADFEIRKAKYIEDKNASKEQQKVETEREERAKALREEAEQKQNAEQLAWVSEHGSDRLKKMVERGYPYLQTYEWERIALELPGALTDDDLHILGRGNPSEEALQKETELIEIYGKDNVKIVWAENEEEEDRGREMIEINTPWNRYLLYIEI